MTQQRRAEKSCLFSECDAATILAVEIASTNQRILGRVSDSRRRRVDDRWQSPKSGQLLQQMPILETVLLRGLTRSRRMPSLLNRLANRTAVAPRRSLAAEQLFILR
jgi:hypothetical protein